MPPLRALISAGRILGILAVALLLTLSHASSGALIFAALVTALILFAIAAGHD